MASDQQHRPQVDQRNDQPLHESNEGVPAAAERIGNALEKLNPRPGTATNAMCTFLALNTSSVQLIPASAVAIHKAVIQWQ